MLAIVINTLVDNHSHYTWVFLMKKKPEALVIIRRFFKIVKNQYFVSIKKFMSNNAPKLAFTDLFASKGVLHQFSYVARPEQNSIVERKHQHLLNVTRALLF